jgi:hypothetical protein
VVGGGGEGSQPYLGARAGDAVRSHDDGWVVPRPWGDAAAQSLQAVRRLPLPAGRRRPDRGHGRSWPQLFGLASADGRKRPLPRTLTGALGNVSTRRASGPAGLQQRMREGHVLNAYLGQLDEAAARSDGNGVRDLADELTTIPAAVHGSAIAALTPRPHTKRRR